MSKEYLGTDSGRTPAIAEVMRLAMRGTASSVCAVTTALPDGSWRGATVITLISVSLNPPSVLVSLDSASRIHAAVLSTRRFGVTVFALQHRAIAASFADPTKHDERFAIGNWLAGDDGLPVLADAVANLSCKTADTLLFGDHTVFVGGVERVSSDQTQEPLVYHDGRYGHWIPDIPEN